MLEIPKGFFPQQDTGIIAGLSDAPQDISFDDEMVRRQHASRLSSKRTPTSPVTVRDSAAAGRSTTGSYLIASSRATQRTASADRDHHPPAAPNGQVSGATLFLQASQDLNSAAAPREPNISTRCRIRTSTNSTTGPEAARRTAEAADAARRRSDQQTSSGMLSLTIDRDQASRFGIQPAAIDQAL